MRRVARRRLRRDVDAGGGGRPRRAASRDRRSSHRYAHAPVRHADGSLRWDWDRLVADVDRRARRGARAGAGRVDRHRHVGRRLRAARRGRRGCWRRRSAIATDAPTAGAAVVERIGAAAALPDDGRAADADQHHLPARGARSGRARAGGTAADAAGAARTCADGGRGRRGDLGRDDGSRRSGDRRLVGRAAWTQSVSMRRSCR